MKILRCVFWVALLFLTMSTVAFAQLDSSKPQVGRAVLRNITDDEQNRQLTEIARSLADVDRRVSRLEDRFEKLDHDMKELKRKL